jgi:hypothetical protein
MTTLSAEFLFDVGDYVATLASIDQDRPPKMQIIRILHGRDMDGDRRLYHIRSHSQFSSELLECFEAELMPYPDPEFFLTRDFEREAVRQEMRERYLLHRAKLAKPKE